MQVDVSKINIQRYFITDYSYNLFGDIVSNYLRFLIKK